MDLNIITKEKNEVFKRQEVVAETSEKLTPSKEAVQEKLAAVLNVPKERIVVSKIKTGFGDQKATIYARAYESEEQMKSVEPEYMMKRNFKEAPVAEEKAEEEAPKAEEVKEEPKAEEKPTEEVKEEPKAEEKKEEKKEEAAPVEEKAEEAPKEEKKEGEQ